MHSHRRHRGKVLFEVLCASALAASFVAAWDQTGSSALLASASVMALVAVYWSVGLFSRSPQSEAVQFAAAVPESLEAQLETEVQAQIAACTIPAEPEPVAAAPKKPRAKKARKAAAVDTQIDQSPETVAQEEPITFGPPLEQLFDPPPFVRQPRAFGRKARGPAPLSPA